MTLQVLHHTLDERARAEWQWWVWDRTLSFSGSTGRRVDGSQS